MRLVRLAALFGSLMLLTATAVLLVERRSDVRDDQIARLDAAADAVLVSTNATLDQLRLVAAQAIAAVPAEVNRADLDRTADVLAMASDGAAACVASSAGSSCTGDDLIAFELTGRLLATDVVAAGEVGLGVDTSSELVVAVVQRGSSTNGDAVPVTAVVAVPTTDLVSQAALDLADDGDATTEIRLVDSAADDGRVDPGVVDGERLVRDQVSEPFAIGGLEISTGVDGGIGTFAGAPAFFALLMGLGSVLLVLAAVTFLADRRNLEARAATDDLTGLANRREFERVGAEAVELADRFGTGLTVMVIDLNEFKAINDTLGHQYGDLVLRGTSDRLVRAVRDTDVVGRWGGDEFVVLLPGLDEATAIRSSMERITTTLSSTPVVGDTVMRASIGAAAFPRHGIDLDALLRTADAAMYAAKTTGVAYRVADADLARRANGSLPDAESADELIVSNDYVGPDRRTGGPPEEPEAEPAIDRFDLDEQHDDAAGDEVGSCTEPAAAADRDVDTSSRVSDEDRPPSRELRRPEVARNDPEVDAAIIDELRMIDLVAEDEERRGDGLPPVDDDATPVSAPRPRTGGVDVVDDD